MHDWTSWQQTHFIFPCAGSVALLSHCLPTFQAQFMKTKWQLKKIWSCPFNNPMTHWCLCRLSDINSRLASFMALRLHPNSALRICILHTSEFYITWRTLFRFMSYETLQHLFKRPIITHWMRVIKSFLPWMKKTRRLNFSPLLKTATSWKTADSHFHHISTKINFPGIFFSSAPQAQRCVNTAPPFSVGPRNTSLWCDWQTGNQ